MPFLQLNFEKKSMIGKTCPHASGGRSLSYSLRTHGNPRENTGGSFWGPGVGSIVFPCWIFTTLLCLGVSLCFLVSPVSNSVRDVIRQCSPPTFSVLFHLCRVCLVVFAWFCISEFRMFGLLSLYMCFPIFVWSSLWSFMCFLCFIYINCSMTYRWVLF